MSRTKELEEKLASMTDEEIAELSKHVAPHTKDYNFIPNPGPQTNAYFSEADILLYGGCVSCDTEFLTPNGWKRIDEWSGDEVAQWDKDTGAVSFAVPKYVDIPAPDGLIRFSHSRMSMVLSDDHRMPLYKWDGEFVVKTAAEVAEKPSRHRVPVTFTVDREGMPLSDDELRLAVAINADAGDFVVRQDGTATCRITLRKDRKINRLLGLLKSIGAEYKEYRNPNRPTEVRYTIECPLTVREYDGVWWQASQHQLEVIIDEICHWDGGFAGTQGGDISFCSRRRCDVDFLQYAAHACGRVATIGVRKGRGKNHSDIYRLSISKEGSSKCTVTLRVDAVKIERTDEYDRMYCFKVPTTYWIARHRNLIFITGNSPGGGKSALGIGLALNEHYRSIIIRKNFADLEGIIDNAKKISGEKDSFVGGNRPLKRNKNGGVIHFAGLSDDGSIGGHQGVDHDLIYVDEAAQIPEQQIRIMIGWLRSDRPGQRCRVVFGSNPPLDATGDWMMSFFAPWFDPMYQNPAKPGELRWFLPNPEGGDMECKKGETVTIDGIEYHAMSRTYIPSKFTDNPFYKPEEYSRSLAALPEDARKILMSGSFLVDRPDSLWQLFPSDWVDAAVARWNELRPEGMPMSSIGVDVAQGGRDQTVLARRHDGWFDEIIRVPGKKTPEGPEVAALVVRHRRGKCTTVVDMGGGFGGGVKTALNANGIKVTEYKGNVADDRLKKKKDPVTGYGFNNYRSYAYWELRRALDPDQDGGSRIALPNDTALIAELKSIEYKQESGKYIVESKKDYVKRLKRSPDAMDAVVMSWFDGPRDIRGYHPAHRMGNMRDLGRGGHEPRVITKRPR